MALSVRPEYLASVNWGDVPTWLAAVATLLALAAALIAGRTAKRLYDIETRRDNEAAAAGRRSQARQVAAWLGPRPDGHQLALYLRNGSPEPAYNVEVTLLHRNPDGQLEPISPTIGQATLPPSNEPLTHDLPSADFVTTPSGTRGRQVCVSLTFMDAAGVRWRRNHIGQLSEIDIDHA